MRGFLYRGEYFIGTDKGTIYDGLTGAYYVEDRFVTAMKVCDRALLAEGGIFGRFSGNIKSRTPKTRAAGL